MTSSKPTSTRSLTKATVDVSATRSLSRRTHSWTADATATFTPTKPTPSFATRSVSLSRTVGFSHPYATELSFELMLLIPDDEWAAEVDHLYDTGSTAAMTGATSTDATVNFRKSLARRRRLLLSRRRGPGGSDTPAIEADVTVVAQSWFRRIARSRLRSVLLQWVAVRPDVTPLGSRQRATMLALAEPFLLPDAVDGATIQRAVVEGGFAETKPSSLALRAERITGRSFVSLFMTSFDPAAGAALRSRFRWHPLAMQSSAAVVAARCVADPFVQPRADILHERKQRVVERRSLLRRGDPRSRQASPSKSATSARAELEMDARVGANFRDDAVSRFRKATMRSGRFRKATTTSPQKEHRACTRSRSPAAPFRPRHDGAVGRRWSRY